MRHKTFTHYVLIGALVASPAIEAARVCESVAKVASAQGRVDVQPYGAKIWQSIRKADQLCPGDTLRTSKWSRATLTLSNQAVITVDQSTTMTFSAPQQNASSWFINLLEGSTFFRSRQSQRLEVQTPFINAVHKGTEFMVTVSSQQAEISVFDGQVVGQNAAGNITIDKGFKGIAEAGRPPRLQALKITPEDAVQWSLYYPPIIDDSPSSQSAIGKPAINSPQSAALAAYHQGDSHLALATLDQIPATQQKPADLTLKAALLLTVGRLDEAQPLIQQAQQREPNNSNAFALQAIIAVALNQQQAAQELANKAVTANPQSAIAKIAQSYAYQALFKLDLALTATLAATRLNPANALAWARLSELQLSLGDHDAALKSAQQAQTRNPKIARTQTILGFADLAQTDIAQAKQAFEQALSLDSSDPLARLGLGLAKIRQGDLEVGKDELETAVNLDPNNAVIRSYLGKAYYELRNKDYASKEFDIAKEMDPKDPTPYFYDAILKQTTNRPVEALHDMQKAIELNDNRGVYRSKLLLDKDEAARSAAQGRIYNDLGFQRRGLVESWKSTNSDPSNYSSHRLMADSYAFQPRHEIARVSELLQSQLLQPNNITPLQPSLAESNLNIQSGLGPTTNSFNEFNPLFMRDNIALQSSGVVGSNNTYGDEVVLAGLRNNTSFSLGQMHYQTDGFRKNNDLTHNLYNALIQHSITPNLNVQAEYRRKESNQGDLVLNFDPSIFSLKKRRSLIQDTARIGGHYSASSNTDYILSGIYTEIEGSILNNDGGAAKRSSTGYQIEMQQLFKHDCLNIRTGGGYAKVDGNLNITFPGIPAFPVPENENYGNLYTYGNLNFPSHFTWTLGASSDFINSLERSVTKIHPKFGLQWDVVDWMQIRAAYFKSTKRALLVNQTIEPTQVAGFNQFFDDFNGTDTTRYGVGVDFKISKSAYAGIEYSRRLLKIPALVGEAQKTIMDQRSETLARAYWYWTPYQNWAVSGELEYERFHRSESDQSVTNDGEPMTVDTISIPLSVRYFDPSGFFSTLNGTFVNQNVSVLKPSSPHGADTFFLVDAKIGYRFPNRRGIVSLEAKNLFDQNFNYQDRNVQANGESETPSILPDRVILFRATLALD
jgi:Tfp pilus assembly protein PilF